MALVLAHSWLTMMLICKLGSAPWLVMFRIQRYMVQRFVVSVSQRASLDPGEMYDTSDFHQLNNDVSTCLIFERLTVVPVGERSDVASFLSTSAAVGVALLNTLLVAGGGVGLVLQQPRHGSLQQHRSTTNMMVANTPT